MHGYMHGLGNLIITHTCHLRAFYQMACVGDNLITQTMHITTRSTSCVLYIIYFKSCHSLAQKMSPIGAI